MAFSQSVMRSQAPVKCGICETDRPIQWECIDCSKLLCDHCKEKVHPEFQKAKDHQVITKVTGQSTVAELSINKQYQTQLPEVGHISYNDDDSLWISNGTDKVLQRVKPEGTKLKILSSYHTRVFGMAVTQSNNLLMSTGKSRLKQISNNTGTLTDSVYNVTPFFATAVHVNSENKVLVGGSITGHPSEGRNVVTLMNQNGDHERVYEHDQHKQPIFTYPGRITSSSNGNIHVLDLISIYTGGRIVVLGHGGDIINIYTGDTEINKVRPFFPGDLATTPSDNVIVADGITHTLHILNNAGLLMTYYKTKDRNIQFPLSLTFSTKGHLYIGCAKGAEGSTCRSKEPKIFEVTILGY
ncbi:uncharacterized protein LOC134716709 [Mytilus trossulus]|uniref:uncharacterized protein LOC134716709 n=1 Tax=Mytilus trossulus TaxID=6551 RepID=UPI00300547AB